LLAQASLTLGEALELADAPSEVDSDASALNCAKASSDQPTATTPIRIERKVRFMVSAAARVFWLAGLCNIAARANLSRHDSLTPRFANLSSACQKCTDASRKIRAF